MKKLEAKILALEILRYYDTQIYGRRKKTFLPERIRKQITPFKNYCPMCELFCNEPRNGQHCKSFLGECPLTCPECNNVKNEALQKNIAALEAWNPEPDSDCSTCIYYDLALGIKPVCKLWLVGFDKRGYESCDEYKERKGNEE